MSQYSSTQQPLLGDAHVGGQVLAQRVAQRSPGQPAAVLGQVVERDAQLAPVGQLEREVVEVRRLGAHQRDRVVVGAQAQPVAGLLEAIADRHAQHVGVEVGRRLQVGR